MVPTKGKGVIKMSEPIYGLDTIKIGASIPLEVYMKLKKRANERDVSLSHYVGIMIYAHTQKDPWTLEDEKERQRLIKENIRKRAERKAKKGCN